MYKVRHSWFEIAPLINRLDAQKLVWSSEKKAVWAGNYAGLNLVMIRSPFLFKILVFEISLHLAWRSPCGVLIPIEELRSTLWVLDFSFIRRSSSLHRRRQLQCMHLVFQIVIRIFARWWTSIILKFSELPRFWPKHLDPELGTFSFGFEIFLVNLTHIRIYTIYKPFVGIILVQFAIQRRWTKFVSVGFTGPRSAGWRGFYKHFPRITRVRYL